MITKPIYQNLKIIYQKKTKKLLRRQNINNQINSGFKPATDLKKPLF